MNKMLAYGFMLWIFSFQVFAAQTDGSRTITDLAIEANDKGYFRVVEGFTLPCQYSVVYFDVASSSGKGYLSLLLAAKMSGKQVSVTYTKDVNNICDITHVEIK